MNEKEIELIDGFFNKGWCCDLDEVYKAVMKLQNNWNELKEFVEKHIKGWEKEEREWIKLGFMKVGGEANKKIIFKMVQKKMQELQGDDKN